MSEHPIDRSTGASLWRQIEERLRTDILTGLLHHRLPNETVLAERFQVNRHTVRQAVKALAESGLVDVVHGSGTFVREDIIDYQVGRRSRLAHSVAKARRVGKSRVLRWTTALAQPEVRQLLDLPEDASVLTVDTLDVVDDKVIGVCIQYFPLPRFAGLGEVYAELGSTHRTLARFGVHEFQRRLSRVTARLPEKTVAHWLAQPVAMPILYVETVYIDAHGQAIEYGISQFSSTAVQVVIEPD